MKVSYFTQPAKSSFTYRQKHYQVKRIIRITNELLCHQKKDILENPESTDEVNETKDDRRVERRRVLYRG